MIEHSRGDLDSFLRLRFFADWPAEEAGALASHPRMVHLDPGETLIRVGDRGHDLYIVVSGRLRLRVEAPARSAAPHEVIVTTGYCVDEALPLHDEAAGFSVEALEPTVVMALAQDALLLLANRQLPLRRRLLRALLLRLAAEEDGQPPSGALVGRGMGGYQIFGPLHHAASERGTPGPLAYYLARDVQHTGSLCVLYYRARTWHRVTAVRLATLADVVEAFGPVPEGVAVAWMAELCLSLASWHQKRIVYTVYADLSPDKVAIKQDGQISAALPDGHVTEVKRPVGPFTPPEIQFGLPVTVATDVYSLGALLAYAATGSPWADPAAPISTPLRELLERSTAARVAERLPSLREFARALAALPLLATWLPAQQTEQVQEQRRPRPEPARKRGWLGVGMLASVIVIGGLIGLSVRMLPTLMLARPASPRPASTTVALVAAVSLAPTPSAHMQAPAAAVQATAAPLTVADLIDELSATTSGCTGASPSVVHGIAYLRTPRLALPDALSTATHLQPDVGALERHCAPAKSAHSSTLVVDLRATLRRQNAAALRLAAEALVRALRQSKLCPSATLTAAIQDAQTLIRQSAIIAATGQVSPAGAATMNDLARSVAALQACPSSGAGPSSVKGSLAAVQTQGRLVYMLGNLVSIETALSLDTVAGGPGSTRAAVPAQLTRWLAPLPLYTATLHKHRAPLKHVTLVASTGGGQYRVVPGDNLWDIAAAHYGTGFDWVILWNANKNRLMGPGESFTDPNLIYPDWTLIVPRRSG